MHKYQPRKPPAHTLVCFQDVLAGRLPYTPYTSDFTVLLGRDCRISFAPVWDCRRSLAPKSTVSNRRGTHTVRVK